MGDILFKRFLLLCVILCIALGSTVYASQFFQIKVSDEFLVLGRDDEKLAEALGISEDEIKDYCGENVLYLAINKENSKQIRLTAAQNDFTNSVINISNFSNEKISKLVPQITGIDGVRGEIIDKNGQKFIKTEMRSNDSGGEFILTEYITVADKRSFVLSFYTNIGVNRDYIEKTFENYNCDYFYNKVIEDEETKKLDILSLVIPALTIVFGVVVAVVGVSVIYELRKRKVAVVETELETPDTETDEAENQE